MNRLVVAALLVSSPALANRIGIVGRARLGCGDAACHDGRGDAPTLTLDAPARVMPGERVELELRVGGGQAHAGCNVASDTGVLAPRDDRLQFMQGQLTHLGGPTAYTGDAATFRFTWSAPTADAVATLSVAANSVDDDLTRAGDGWTLAEVRILVGDATLPDPAADEGGCHSVPGGRWSGWWILVFGRRRRADSSPGPGGASRGIRRTDSDPPPQFRALDCRLGGP